MKHIALSGLRGAAMVIAALVAGACSGVVRPDFGGGESAPQLASVECVTGARMAKLSATVDGVGAGISECGFRWLEDGTGVDEHTVVAAFAGTDGVFSAEIDGLEPSTSYTFYAYIGNGVNRIESSRMLFSTLAEADPPAPGPYVPTDPSAVVPVPDPVLRGYLLWHYDTDSDGELSAGEAAEIRAIELMSDEIASLSGIEYCGNLSHLAVNASRNSEDEPSVGRLTSVDLSHNALLRELNFEYQNLASLDLSGNPELVAVSIFKSPIRSLDLSLQRKLTLFSAGYCKLESMDLSDSSALEEVHLDHNNLSSLQLGELLDLQYLDCSSNKLATLDVSGCRSLNALDCHDNPELKTVVMKTGQALGIMIKDSWTKIVFVD